jgi:hypothetical protein
MYDLYVKKKKLIKTIDEIILKKEKGIEIDFADEAYSIVEDVDKDLYELTGYENITYSIELEEEMFPESEFYKD